MELTKAKLKILDKQKLWKLWLENMDRPLNSYFLQLILLGYNKGRSFQKAARNKFKPIKKFYSKKCKIVRFELSSVRLSRIKTWLSYKRSNRKN